MFIDGPLTVPIIEAAYSRVLERVRKIEADAEEGEEVKMAELHLHMARDMTIGENAIEDAPDELKTLGMFANRMIKEYGGLDDLLWTLDFRENALNNEIRGVRDAPAVIFYIEDFQQTEAASYMNMIEGVSIEKDVLRVRIPWMQLQDEDFGTLTVDQLKGEKDKEQYQYWTNEAWAELMGKGLLPEIKAAYGSRVEFLVDDPEKDLLPTGPQGQKRGRLQDRTWQPYVPHGYYNLVRVKKMNIPSKGQPSLQPQGRFKGINY